MAFALLPLLACAVLLGQAGLRAFAGAAPQAQKPAVVPGSESPFCSFVRKVVAAAPGEFAEFKGEEDTLNGAVTDHTIFKGTLVPDSTSDCSLFIRHKEDEKVIPPTYYCVLGPFRTVADATPVYEKDAAELRACFPEWQFTEKRGADKSAPTEVHTFSTRQPGMKIVFTLNDMGLSPSQGSPNSSQSGAVLSLQMTATAPAAPPVPEKKR
jgi:hypothetical protein